MDKKTLQLTCKTPGKGIRSIHYKYPPMDGVEFEIALNTGFTITAKKYLGYNMMDVMKTAADYRPIVRIQEQGTIYSNSTAKKGPGKTGTVSLRSIHIWRKY